MKISTSGPAQAAATAIDKSPLPPINPEAEVPDNEDLGFSRPKTSNVTRSPRKLPKGPALCDVSGWTGWGAMQENGESKCLCGGKLR